MFSTHQQPPPAIPPSPTLSNPDMILPFDDNERENSTPSPPFNLPSLSHLQSFYESRTNYTNGYNNNLDPTRHSAPRPQKKAFPRHTWMHEGHSDAASRRLSDIGEMGEEDHTGSPYRYGGFMKNAQAMAARQSRVLDSPVSLRDAAPEADNDSDGTVSEETGVQAEAQQRAHSSSSNSTTSGASESSSWDGTKGRVEYVTASAQESRGSRGERERRAASGSANGVQGSANAQPANKGGGPDEDQSAMILESEAERILESAKTRLSLMEGNLTRARSTMRSTTPSQSSSAPHSPGLGQPVGGLYQSLHRAADRRSSMLRPRQSRAQDTSNNRHSRVYSEINLPSVQPKVENKPSRSVSAMGSSTSTNIHNDERSFHYAPTRAYLTHRPSVSSMQRQSAQAAKERSSSDSSPVYEEAQGEHEDDLKPSNMDEFNTVYPVQDPPSRSQSQTQVRDLQDQMKGLHIKISTLKVKAQEDGLRRRSLQSLRTPSPLTAATHWYANHLDPSERHRLSASYGQYLDSPINSHFGGSVHASHSNTNSTAIVPDTVASEPRQSTDIPILPPFELTDHEDDHSGAESLYEDAEEEIDREALEEILREPLDDDLNEEELAAFHDDTPHEEREDAFDYEHFILHSALGNYTQARMRRPSNASETSVETTRPIRKRRSMRHSRSNSATSLSTVGTFATATEGKDDVDSMLYWDRRFNDELDRRYVDSDEEDPDTPESDTQRTPRKSLAPEARSQHPDSAANGTATPTSLASSLVSTVRAAASPHPSSTNSHLGINEDDTKLLEHLFKSLGDVCMNLQGLTTSPEYDEKQAKLLRRRLEAARRVLDGELD